MHEQPRLISLQRSEEEPRVERAELQADGKMFLFSLLKLFIKGSLLLEVSPRAELAAEADAMTREKEIVVS